MGGRVNNQGIGCILSSGSGRIGKGNSCMLEPGSMEEKQYIEYLAKKVLSGVIPGKLL